ncbi:hypothetical protein [Spirosoma linguale]|uniref:Streptomycin biosynthesis enzyme StrG n=1 Tax=Spirosoma linguale (strain ATCC 33905 / DSM 74 / LMG 10896 / Claus 1) TaxID=504472 RepID=D2QBX4_SPILD|nr:conserved hypothetical protein [Spirosoma linguale DSM 74]
MITVFRYDTSVYKFRDWAELVLGHQNLERINEKTLQNAKAPKNRVYQFITLMKNAFEADNDIRELFGQFVKNEVAIRIDFEPWLSIYPNFRVHEADQEATSPFHRDRDYLKERGSLKVWLPFTHVSKGGTLWVESEEGKKDYRPYEMKYGEALLFDSLNLEHGCFFNDSGSCRVSMDFIIRKNPMLV